MRRVESDIADREGDESPTPRVLSNDSVLVRRRRRSKSALAIATSQQALHKSKELSWEHRWKIGFVFILFLLCLLLMYGVLPQAPAGIKVPHSLVEAQEVARLLKEHTEDNYYKVLAGFALVYIFLQSFSIPGSAFLSFISGALFGLWTGVFTVCLVSSLGASISYAIAGFIGRGLLHRIFPNRMEYFESKINENRQGIFFYLLFLRITPFLPNWFINLASPVLGVPFGSFFFATYLGMGLICHPPAFSYFQGVMPMTFVTVRAGVTLNQLKQGSETDILIDAIPTLLLLGAVALLPTWKPFQNALSRLFGTRRDNTVSPISSIL